MSSKHDSLSIESPGSYSQSGNGNAAHSPAPAPLSAGARNRILVTRRLNDRVQFSAECSHGEDGSAEALCNTFLAAWG
jgi:hypothetical protein